MCDDVNRGAAHCNQPPDDDDGDAAAALEANNNITRCRQTRRAYRANLQSSCFSTLLTIVGARWWCTNHAMDALEEILFYQFCFQTFFPPRSFYATVHCPPARLFSIHFIRLIFHVLRCYTLNVSSFFSCYYSTFLRPFFFQVHSFNSMMLHFSFCHYSSFYIIQNQNNGNDVFWVRN